MLKPTVLIVDDEKPTVKACGRHWRIAMMSTSPRTARRLRLLEEDGYDVLTDPRMPGIAGLT